MFPQYPLNGKNPVKKSAGISFLEIIIVLFMIGVITGVSLPNFVRLATSTVELEGRRLSNMLRDLQALSILTSKEVRLALNSQHDHMQILTRTQEYEWVPHSKYPDPIPLFDGVKIKTAQSNKNENTDGGSIYINILPSGFIDIFSVEFYDDNYTIKVQTEGVMGKVVISEVTQNVRIL